MGLASKPYCFTRLGYLGYHQIIFNLLRDAAFGENTLLPLASHKVIDVIRRIYEHKNKLVKGLAQKYNVDRLVYYEACDNIVVAIQREKQIKGWSRKKKNDLVNAFNSEWKDLYQSIC